MLYIDTPRWPAHGRLWAHLISDVSVAELHAFAELIGAPWRAFERDHYDVSSEGARIAVWLGARQVTSREIVERLVAAGLRRPRHLSAFRHPDQGKKEPAQGLFSSRT
ncbi:DUF4031 domain-containing protein [Dactylosporangium sp. NPDC051484]|uniref:DUF4031 domain-containing protein n=1 Tax=Dactylosporangium sp. NPDC051484 TaxID=3154942 RepID=UPI00344C0CB7